MPYLTKWLAFPKDYTNHLKAVLPLALSLVLQRLYHIVDNRFVGKLGDEALLIHNVQYNFIVLGLFLGVASSTSCLIFWKREECQNRQGSILIKHTLITLAAALFFAIPFALFSGQIVSHYGITSAYQNFAQTYVLIGLLNMVLQSVYGSLDGMLVASGQQKRGMFLSSLLVVCNLITDGSAVYFLYDSQTAKPQAIFSPLLMIILSTTALSIIMIAIATTLIAKRTDGWENFPLKDIFPVWKGEAGIAIIRSLSPLIYAYQLGLLQTSKGFLVTYNLTLHMAYLFCLPLAAGLQIATRDASEAFTKNQPATWWNVFFYTAHLPTILFLLLGLAAPKQLMALFYGFSPPSDHLIFVHIFFLACLFGQIGHIFAVPLRVRKKSTIVTRNMLFAEFGVLIGGTQILIWLGQAKPETICWVTFVFSSLYTVLNGNALLKLIRIEGKTISENASVAFDLMGSTSLTSK